MSIDLTALDAANTALQKDSKAAKTTKNYANEATKVFHAIQDAAQTPVPPQPEPPSALGSGAGSARWGNGYDTAPDGLGTLNMLLTDANTCAAPHDLPHLWLFRRQQNIGEYSFNLALLPVAKFLKVGQR